MRRNLVPLFLLLTLTLVAAACSDEAPPDEPAGPGDNGDDTWRNDDGQVVIEVDGSEIVLTAGLSGFDDCDVLLDHLRTEAVERVGPYGFGGGWFGTARWIEDDIAVDMAEEAAFDGDDAGADMTAGAEVGGGAYSSAPVEGVDFSGTNVQEVGVDEADIIKTDGNRVFVVAADQLIVVDAAEREVVGTVDLPGTMWQAELFLDGDDLLLVSTGWSEIGVLSPDAVTTSGNDEALDAPYFDTTTVRIVRITLDGDDPRIVEQMLVEGEYVSSRAIDGTARVIIRSNPQHHFPFVYPQNENGEDVAERANRDAVLNADLDAWLPSFAMLDGRGDITGQGLLPDCGAVHAPTEFSGFGVLSVVSIGVGGDIDEHKTTSVLAPGSVVYASTESVYVATQTWIDTALFEDDDEAWERAWEARQTSVHRFALAGDDASYTASGSVPGDIRDQFNLSEHDGHLRIVTTTGETWDETSETHVRILRETDGALVEVGAVGDMGRGEAVQSVRMIGAVGYVVTFRQIDPFYTLDLSDPENPQVVGELKIPGFSSYLHPIGQGRVLGVGSDGDADGRITGSKVSIFDVTDPADPQEVAIWSAPGGWNDVGWEHRSFLWWEAEQMAVIPLTSYDENGHWAGAVVLRVDGTELVEVGRIDQADDDAAPGVDGCQRVTAEDISGFDPDDEGSFDSELEWMLAFDEESQIRLCADGEKPTADGFDCYEEPWLLDEAGRIGIALPPDATLWMCWPRWNQMPTIVRTMVLDGDELWTLGNESGWYAPDQPATLQINDLTSLERLDRINLS